MAAAARLKVITWPDASIVVRPLARWSMTLRLKASRSAIFSDAASTATSAQRRFSASWPARNATARKANTLMPTVTHATSTRGSTTGARPSAGGGTEYWKTTMATKQRLASPAIRRLPRRYWTPAAATMGSA